MLLKQTALLNCIIFVKSIVCTAVLCWRLFPEGHMQYTFNWKDIVITWKRFVIKFRGFSTAYMSLLISKNNYQDNFINVHAISLGTSQLCITGGLWVPSKMFYIIMLKAIWRWLVQAITAPDFKCALCDVIFGHVTQNTTMWWLLGYECLSAGVVFLISSVSVS